MLNNADRPPVKAATATAACCTTARRCRTSTKWTNAPASTALITNRVWRKLGSARRTRCTTSAGANDRTARRLRLGVPDHRRRAAAHFIGGYAGTVSERQPAMYFRLGGGTVKGISKPGEIVWSRIFVEDGKLQDGPRPRQGRRTARRRRPSAAGRSPRRSGRSCTPCIYGVTRDQMMARHKSNHIQVAYCPRRRRRQPRARRQGRAVPRHGHGSDHLRHGSRAVRL